MGKGRWGLSSHDEEFGARWLVAHRPVKIQFMVHSLFLETMPTGTSNTHTPHPHPGSFQNIAFVSLILSPWPIDARTLKPIRSPGIAQGI